MFIKLNNFVDSGTFIYINKLIIQISIITLYYYENEKIKY